MDRSLVQKVINIARWAARIITIVYLPFVLYMWLLSAYVVYQGVKGMPGFIYAMDLVAISALAVGYILLFWREVAGSRVVLIAAIALILLDTPLLGMDIKTMWLLLKLNWFIMLRNFVLLLLPVVILYFCRRYSEKSVND